MTQTGISNDVAAIVSKRRADCERDVIGAAIDRRAFRRREAAVYDAADFVVVVVLVHAVLAINTNALEFTVHLEVDDTSNGVGTIGRRSATGEDFNAGDQRRRDEVQVSSGATTNATRHQATAVNENQRTAGTQAAERNGSSTVCAVRNARVLSCKNLRQRVQKVFDLGRALALKVFATNDGNRRSRFFVGTLDERTGDNDRCAVGFFASIILSERWRRDERQTERNRRGSIFEFA